MTKASTLIDTNSLLPIVNNKLNPIAYSNSIKLSRDKVVQCDVVLKDFQDLFISDYRPWFCQSFYSIGCERFVILAKEARSGRSPKRLFTFLIKKELGI